MSNGYKITRSNYTLKKRHQTLSGGVVYERDFMTTTNLGSWDSGSIPYGESNFKMFYRAANNVKKLPYQGEWLKCSGDSEYFTADCVTAKTNESADKIEIKPNYNSLLDFAYYGSCAELVKSTITKIIKNFPAEMYIVDGSPYGFSDENLLINNFQINLTDVVIPEGENPIRYFLNSFNNYEIETPNGTSGIFDVEFKNYYTPGLNEEERNFLSNKCNFLLIIKKSENISYALSGITYPTGISAVLAPSALYNSKIAPSEEIKDNFFSNLDDFEKVLLNDKTNPKYTAVLDTPKETERGVDVYQVAYTWPIENDWNLVIDGYDFHEYINGILSIAEFYDEYYTDNLWRMLTHDSIKAMDIAFSNPQKDEDSDDYNVGATRLEGLFWAIGRQFDEIKRAIDNIKNTSKVSYDSNNNLPDYFLSDALELNGFDISNINMNLSSEDKVDGKALFTGVSCEYKSNDANYYYLRNLKLNAGSILSKKGTRQGIEALLGIFGFISKDMWDKFSSEDKDRYDYDYEIAEYIGVVSDSYDATGAVDFVSPVESLNMLKGNKSTDVYVCGKKEGDVDTFEGIPCMAKYVSENGTDVKYLIPWFDKTKDYDGHLYYQQKGGWGRNEDTGEYIETAKYAIVVSNLQDLVNIPSLRIYDGCVAYVINVDTDQNNRNSYASHYFELAKKENQAIIGEGGWTNVEDMVKIYHLDHIIETINGNNPHTGFGNYDNGEEYIEYLRNPLKYTLDNDTEDNHMFNDSAYDCNGDYKVYNRKKVFDIDTDSVDNIKCWYFNPLLENGSVKVLEHKDGDAPKKWFKYESDDDEILSVSGFQTFDFLLKETGNKADEITCDSIINTKKVIITFRINGAYLNEFKTFFNESIMPYLRQVLPSGSLFEYNIVPFNVVNAGILAVADVLKDVAVVAAGRNDSYDDIIFNYVEGETTKPISLNQSNQ